MATIQIRDIPDDAYSAIVEKAKANGQSIQQFMRQHVIDFAFVPDKAQLAHEIRADIAKYGPLATSDEILAAIEAGRR